MFDVPDRWQLYQDDVSLTIELFDTWQYNPDAYFGEGRNVPFFGMGDANSEGDWDLAHLRVNMLNQSQPHSFILYAATKTVSFVRYYLERLKQCSIGLDRGLTTCYDEGAQEE